MSGCKQAFKSKLVYERERINHKSRVGRRGRKINGMPRDEARRREWRSKFFMSEEKEKKISLLQLASMWRFLSPSALDNRHPYQLARAFSVLHRLKKSSFVLFLSLFTTLT
jgi:hypothetical protein